VGTYGRGLWSIPLVKAVSIAQPAMVVAPTAMVFGTQQVATQSTAQSVTVTSTGNAPVVFGQATVSAGFALAADTCSWQTLVANATCSVSVMFAPTVTGAASGALTIFANVSGWQASVALSGTGMAAANVTLNPVAVSFAETVVGQTAQVQNITVNNTGGTTATLQAAVLQQVGSDYAITQNSCGASLAASSGCTITVSFTPTAAGTRTATLAITDTSTGTTATQSASLSGVGDAPATDTLSATTLNFPQSQVGASSNALTVTLTNSGGVALALSAPSVSSNEFTVTNHCGTSLPAQTTCAYAVVFVPSATGARAAVLTITDAVRSQTVQLTGEGLAPPGVSLSPATLTYAATGSGLASLPQTVTLTNNGGTPLVLANAPVVSGNFVIAQNGCTTTIAVGASCSMMVVFAPTAAGAAAGALTLTDNAPSGRQVVSLSGTGVDFSLSANGPTSATVSSGVGASFGVLLSSLPTLSGNVALTCTGAPKNSTCTVSPTTPSLGGTSVLIVTVQTGVQASLRPGAVFPWMHSTEVLAFLLLPVGLWRRRRGLVLVMMLVALCGGVEGCGTGRSIPVSGTNVSYVTPGGTYALTVTGTAAGVVHAVTLTLVVQ
ncbi:MAG: choice-of-anchor D domain-containing protein, partial [Bryocella sp.]